MINNAMINKVTITTSFSILLMACALPPSASTQTDIPVKGNCGAMTCTELWRSLQNRWSAQLADLQQECPEVQTYGLNVWGEQGTKQVSVICWDATTVGEDGTIYGNYYRTFPYPGDEATFLAPTECHGDPDCTAIWVQLTTAYPREITEMQQTCAFRNGFLIYQPTDQPQAMQVSCAFFAPNIQMDDNGDGVMDGEGKPTGVDFPLGVLELGAIR